MATTKLWRGKQKLPQLKQKEQKNNKINDRSPIYLPVSTTTAHRKI